MKARFVECPECDLRGWTTRLACECGRIFREKDVVLPPPSALTLFGLRPREAAA